MCQKSPGRPSCSTPQPAPVCSVRGRRAWLLKYIIYVIFKTAEDAEVRRAFFFSLRSSAHSAVSIELVLAPVVLNLPPPLHSPTGIEKQRASPSGWIICSYPAPILHEPGPIPGLGYIHKRDSYIK